jgi:ATP-dependent protease ClpP protease subunit
MTDDLILPDRSTDFNTALALDLRKHGWYVLMGGIDTSTCEMVTTAALTAAFSKRPEINLYICSPGGEEEPARATIAAIELAKHSGVIVRAIGAGLVASAAFDIFISCSRGYRFIHEISMLMTHASSADTRNKRMAALTDYLDELTLKAYTKITKSQRDKFLETGDWYLSPQQAIEMGVADAIVKLGHGLPAGPVLPQKKVEVEATTEPEAN